MDNKNLLFYRYQKILSWFVNTDFGKDYLSNRGIYIPKGRQVKLLPNGYISLEEKGKQNTYQMVASVDPNHMEKKVIGALQLLDLTRHYLLNFDEARKVFLWKLGLGSSLSIPSIIQNIHFNQTTFTPDVNNVDGRVSIAGPDTFANLRANAGTSVTIAGADAPAIGASHTPSDTYAEMHRRPVPADTSALTANATLLNTSKIRFYCTGVTTDIAGQSSRLCTTSAPVTANTLVNSDYNLANWNATAQAPDLLFASWATSAYNDFVFNATGLSNINKIGVTRMGLRFDGDADNVAPTWVADGFARLSITGYSGANPTQYVIDYTLTTGSGFFAFL